MKTGKIIIPGCLMEAHCHVEPRADPFAGVDCAGLQRGHNLAAGQSDDDGSQPPEHSGAKPRHAVAQPLEFFWGADLAGEPAAHLSAGVETQERFDVELPAEQIPQLLPAAVMHPSKQLVRGEAERDSGEKMKSRRLSFPIVLC